MSKCMPKTHKKRTWTISEFRPITMLSLSHSGFRKSKRARMTRFNISIDIVFLYLFYYFNIKVNCRHTFEMRIYLIEIVDCGRRC